MRLRQGFAIASLAALAGAGVAVATTVPDVVCKPPRLAFVDRFAHATGEQLEVTKEGMDYVFRNPSGMVRNPNSDKGCDENFNTEFHCPVAGVERLTLRLNGATDTAQIDLGSKADVVRQRVLAGVGGDTILPGPGRQRIFGEDDNDILRGGGGDDFIDGGGGEDDCEGGPGDDTIVNCE